MFKFFERGFLATVGVLSMSREKTQDFVDELVKRGEINREEGKQLVEQMVRRGQEEQENIRKLARQEVQNALRDLDLVTHEDIQKLNEKMDALLKKLEES